MHCSTTLSGRRHTDMRPRGCKRDWRSGWKDSAAAKMRWRWRRSTTKDTLLLLAGWKARGRQWAGMRRAMRMPGRWPTSNTSCRPMAWETWNESSTASVREWLPRRRCTKCCTAITTRGCNPRRNICGRPTNAKLLLYSTSLFAVRSFVALGSGKKSGQECGAGGHGVDENVFVRGMSAVADGAEAVEGGDAGPSGELSVRATPAAAFPHRAITLLREGFGAGEESRAHFPFEGRAAEAAADFKPGSPAKWA